MSRRFLFILAAFVVMLYFSVILFMLGPLHSTRVGFAYSSYHYRRVPNVEWCKKLQWRSPPGEPVALASYPGSGNTWLRYLLQQATGILTGSIYMDHGLRLHGFPAENVTDGSVLVVKTHGGPNDMGKLKSAVLLIRNPRDAILADFNRLHMGHIGTAPKSAFRKKVPVKETQGKKINNLDWNSYVFTQLKLWESWHSLWLTEFSGPLHIVFYEVLVRDTSRILRGVLHFLNYNVTEPELYCAIAHREGIYRRRKKHKDFDPFTQEMYESLNEVKNSVLSLVADYKIRHNQSVTFKRGGNVIYTSVQATQSKISKINS